VLPGYLEEARQIVREVEAGAESIKLTDPPVPPTFERIRWFPLPGEALADLRVAAERGRNQSQRSAAYT
jgi:hypothetical protein